MCGTRLDDEMMGGVGTTPVSSLSLSSLMSVAVFTVVSAPSFVWVVGVVVSVDKRGTLVVEFVFMVGFVVVGLVFARLSGWSS